MCCGNKCMFFISPRLGSLIFGYFSAVVTAIGVLISICFIYFMVTMLTQGQQILRELIYVQLVFIESVSGFTFNVLMLYGITKNKPVLVKTYIIYSMIHLVLIFGLIITFFSTGVAIGGVIMMLVSVIYCSLIYLVFLAYNDMISNKEGQVFSYPPNLIG